MAVVDHEFVQRAEELYTSVLQATLERDHLNEFVAIEPQSGDYFLGKTMSEASLLARKIYPNRMTHIIRVGHKAALHFGMNLR